MDEERIVRLMSAVAKVFSAEESLSEEWMPKLQAANDLPDEERLQVADNYLRAVAIELYKREEGDV